MFGVAEGEKEERLRVLKHEPVKTGNKTLSRNELNLFII